MSTPCLLFARSSTVHAIIGRRNDTVASRQTEQLKINNLLTFMYDDIGRSIGNSFPNRMAH